MGKSFNNFKKELISEIKSIDDPHIMNITLIGSFQNSSKLTKVNDIDLFIVVKELTPLIFKRVINRFEDIAEKLATPKVPFVVESRIAQYKPKLRKGKKIVQLHLLIFPFDVLRAARRDTFMYDCTYFGEKLFGVSLEKISKSILDRQYTLERLKKELRMIKTGYAYGRYYKVIGKKVVAKNLFKKVSKNEYPELAMFNIIIGSLIYVRLYKPKTKKKDLESQARGLIEEPYYSTLVYALELKKKLRQTGKITMEEVNSLRSQGMKLLKYLIKKLSTNPTKHLNKNRLS